MTVEPSVQADTSEDSMRSRVLAVLIVINAFYLVLGGVFYHFVERPKEQDRRKLSEQTRRKLKEEFLVNKTCVSAQELDDLIQRLIDHVSSGQIRGDSTDKWQFAGAVFFSATVITTLGYGNLTPSTNGGRIFTAIYALIGIPLCLTMLAVLGAKIGLLLKRADRFLDKGWFPRCGHVMRLSLILLAGFVLFVLFPALIVMKEEGWTYSESVYFGVITLTTIGFGDFVAGVSPDHNDNWFYRIAIMFWILIGLAWCSTIINAFQELYTSIFYPKEQQEDNTHEASNPELDVGDEKVILRSAGVEGATNGDTQSHVVMETDIETTP